MCCYALLENYNAAKGYRSSAQENECASVEEERE